MVENQIEGIGSRRTGTFKNRTKDCDGCGILVVIENEEWCNWGVGKRLAVVEKPRKCQLLKPNNQFLKQRQRQERFHNIKSYRVIIDDEDYKELLRDGKLSWMEGLNDPGHLT